MEAKKTNEIVLFDAILHVHSETHSAEKPEMEAKKTDEIRLFGATIGVISETHSDKKGVQESDGKGSEVNMSDDDHVDTTLRLSNGSSSHVFSLINDHVDTTLRFFSGSSSHASSLEDPMALCFCPLDIAGPSNYYIMHGQPVLCPMPLRSFPSTSPCPCGECDASLNMELFGESSEKDTDSSATHYAREGTPRYRGETQQKPSQESQVKGTQASSSSNINSDENRRQSVKRKRKRKGVAVSDDKTEPKSAKRRNRSTIASHHRTTEPIPTIDQVPGLLPIIESQNGTQPVFLYRKRLQGSDIRKDQNRIFLTKSEQLVEYLTAEERIAVYVVKKEERNAVQGKGLEIYAVDPEEKSYKLHLIYWESLGMLVLKSEWRKLVESNNVEPGCWVEMWGYRSNGKFCLAVNFRKPEAQVDEGPNVINNGGD